jgi:hypothetical protein
VEGSQPCAGISDLKRLRETLGRNKLEALHGFKVTVCHDISISKNYALPRVPGRPAEYPAISDLDPKNRKTAEAAFCPKLTKICQRCDMLSLRRCFSFVLRLADARAFSIAAMAARSLASFSALVAASAFSSAFTAPCIGSGFGTACACSRSC